MAPLRSAALSAALAAAACTSVEYVRIPPGTMRLPDGADPIAAVQVSRMGFYFLGVEIVESDLDLVLNKMLLEAARKVGADRVVNVHFDATPSSGVWWFFTHVLPFPPSARAWGIAVRDRPLAVPPVSAP